MSEAATILVVDDNATVLSTVRNILKAAHFVVLTAVDAADALGLSERYEGRIDLLLSDIQMPGMSGPELGIGIKAGRPEMRVMLMSGLPKDGLLVLDHGWAYIEKPFVPKKLIEMVHSVLHKPSGAQEPYGYDTSE